MAIPLTATNFGKEAQRFLEDGVAPSVGQLRRAVAADALDQLIKYTPVDTGRARGNWIVSVGEPSEEFNWDTYDPSGSATLAKGVAIISQQRWRFNGRFTSDLYIVNNTPYIPHLEDGRVKDTAKGFMSDRAKTYLNMVYYGGGTLG